MFQPSCGRSPPSAAQCHTARYPKTSKSPLCISMKMMYSQSQQSLIISAFPHELLTVFLLSGMLLGKLSGRRTVFEATPVSCTFWIWSTSSASSDTTQTGFSTSFSTCFRRITSFRHTSLLSTRNSFELGYLQRKSRRLPLNVTKTSRLIILVGWVSTRLSNLGF